MSEDLYTLGLWRVKDGQEAPFVEAWKELGAHIYALGLEVGPATLIQSVEDPHLFYSFGTWGSLEDIAAMRAHPETPAKMGALVALCDEGKPGAFRVVERLP